MAWIDIVKVWQDIHESDKTIPLPPTSEAALIASLKVPRELCAIVHAAVARFTEDPSPFEKVENVVGMDASVDELIGNILDKCKRAEIDCVLTSSSFAEPGESCSGFLSLFSELKQVLEGVTTGKTTSLRSSSRSRRADFVATGQSTPGRATPSNRQTRGRPVKAGDLGSAAKPYPGSRTPLPSGNENADPVSSIPPLRPTQGMTAGRPEGGAAVIEAVGAGIVGGIMNNIFNLGSSMFSPSGKPPFAQASAPASLPRSSRTPAHAHARPGGQGMDELEQIKAGAGEDGASVCQLQEQLISYNTLITSLRSANDRLDKDRRAVQAVATELQAQVDQFATEKEALQTSMRSAIEAEQSASASLASQLAAAQACSSGLEVGKDSAEEEAAHAKAVIADLSGEVQAMHATLQAQNAEIEVMRGALAAAEEARCLASVLAAEAGAERDDAMCALGAENARARDALEGAQAALRSMRAELESVKLAAASSAQEAMAALASLGSSLLTGVAAAQGAASEANARFAKEQAERRRLWNKLQEARGNIRVVARVRPMLVKETEEGEEPVVHVPSSHDVVLHETAGEGATGRVRGKDAVNLEFDRVLHSGEGQVALWEEVQPMVTSALDGYHSTIFAYGQTGSGKTYTMEGPAGVSGPASEEEAGVYVRALRELFSLASSRSFDGWTYSVRASMVEIYNERVRDLLSMSMGTGPGKSGASIEETEEGSMDEDGLDTECAGAGMDPSNLAIRVGKSGGNTLEGATLIPVACSEDVAALMTRGAAARSVGRTNSNEHSSRSHCLLLVEVTGANSITGMASNGRLVLVDLAGSERVSKSGAEGARLKEAQAINKSLSALGDVIGALTSKAQHVPFRNSKLTWLLADSLGKDNKVMMIVQVNPTAGARGETLCSLQFASRVKKVELGRAVKHTDASAELTRARAESKKAGEARERAEVEAAAAEAREKAALARAEHLAARLANMENASETAVRKAAEEGSARGKAAVEAAAKKAGAEAEERARAELALLKKQVSGLTSALERAELKTRSDKEGKGARKAPAPPAKPPVPVRRTASSASLGSIPSLSMRPTLSTATAMMQASSVDAVPLSTIVVSDSFNVDVNSELHQSMGMVSSEDRATEDEGEGESDSLMAVHAKLDGTELDFESSMLSFVSDSMTEAGCAGARGSMSMDASAILSSLVEGSAVKPAVVSYADTGSAMPFTTSMDVSVTGMNASAMLFPPTPVPAPVSAPLSTLELETDVIGTEGVGTGSEPPASLASVARSITDSLGSLFGMGFTQHASRNAEEEVEKDEEKEDNVDAEGQEELGEDEIEGEMTNPLASSSSLFSSIVNTTGSIGGRAQGTPVTTVTTAAVAPQSEVSNSALNETLQADTPVATASVHVHAPTPVAVPAQSGLKSKAAPVAAAVSRATGTGPGPAPRSRSATSRQPTATTTTVAPGKPRVGAAIAPAKKTSGGKGTPYKAPRAGAAPPAPAPAENQDVASVGAPLGSRERARIAGLASPQPISILVKRPRAAELAQVHAPQCESGNGPAAEAEPEVAERASKSRKRGARAHVAILAPGESEATVALSPHQEAQAQAAEELAAISIVSAVAPVPGPAPTPSAVAQSQAQAHALAYAAAMGVAVLPTSAGGVPMMGSRTVGVPTVPLGMPGLRGMGMGYLPMGVPAVPYGGQSDLSAQLACAGIPTMAMNALPLPMEHYMLGSKRPLTSTGMGMGMGLPLGTVAQNKKSRSTSSGPAARVRVDENAAPTGSGKAVNGLSGSSSSSAKVALAPSKR